VPVISVGNLSMGGRGKTPTVARVARLLIDAGERPAILSRGYRRAQPDEGVVIVSDGTHVRADLARSGDEPLLLARTVRGAAVLVCDVRATAAALAQTALGSTVHVLDDGFQHWSMTRDIDIVIVSPVDLDDRRLPFGRLRSPVSALRQASAVLVDGGTAPDIETRLSRHVRDVAPVFGLHRGLGAPWWIDGPARPVDRDQPVVAVAGIAGPERFVRALQRDGWRVGELVGFRDHHAFTRRDLARIAGVAAGRTVVTTEKDAMRLLPLRPLPVPVAAVPLTVSVEPAEEFRNWLLRRLREVRG
jgi:tetraacyldisaccharide 4'-kinase